VIDATPLLRLYAAVRRTRRDGQDPAVVQARTLMGLVRRAADTRFGRDHDFAAIRTVADFQARVPLRDYDAMWRDYWQAAFPVFEDLSWPGRAPFLALSSGTATGKTKYIPVTADMVRSNRKAGLDVLADHLAAKPGSRIFGGQSFMLGGSTALTREAPGVESGDLSGIAAKTLPVWARSRSFPDLSLAVVSDWREKIERLADAALDRDLRVLTGVPAWVLELLDRMAEKRRARGEDPARPLPHLELFVHGGVAFAPYRERFERRFAGLGVDFREVYPASEGFVAHADRGPDDGLRLHLDHGIFFEFVPLEEAGSANPTRRWVGDVETGVDYAVVLSTCAGLFGYVLGDVVRFVSLAPPRLIVTGRLGRGLSVFGEHLIGAEIEAAVATAAADIGADVTDFSVGPVFAGADGERDGHLFIVEFAVPPPPGAVDRFAQVLDTDLAHRNDDYRAHRAEGVGIAPPRVQPAPPGTFAAWMRARGKEGGQHKVPRAIADPVLWGELREFVGR
jgi:hypothetical protein